LRVAEGLPMVVIFLAVVCQRLVNDATAVFGFWFFIDGLKVQCLREVSSLIPHCFFLLFFRLPLFLPTFSPSPLIPLILGEPG